MTRCGRVRRRREKRLEKQANLTIGLDDCQNPVYPGNPDPGGLQGYTAQLSPQPVNGGPDAGRISPQWVKFELGAMSVFY